MPKNWLIVLPALAVVTLPPALAMAMDPATLISVANVVAPLIPDNIGSVISGFFTIGGVLAHMTAALPISSGKSFGKIMHTLAGNYGHAFNAKDIPEMLAKSNNKAEPDFTLPRDRD
ncbi:hypothetical protein SIID45300_02403 [Candidatus Magnetaquicoccaceae bacterium FCR-1]|uniref:Secreted protein n=1 Tax=Candidatus Magnetaquiglobus chichijimensis TaxID=3141448 RepID=A0ABQ0CB13_9PROT